jgi:hypothetical protein
MITQLRPPPETFGKTSFEYPPEGWLFTISDPWLFFKRRTYRLTEKQKPSVVARLRRGRIIRLFVVVPLLVLLAKFISDNPIVGWPRLLQAAFSIAALTIVLVSLLNAIEYLAVGSLLSDLPFDSHRISWAETFLGHYPESSVTVLLVWTSLCTLVTALGIFRLLTSEHVHPLGVISTILIGLVALAKTRALIVTLTRRLEN